MNFFTLEQRFSIQDLNSSSIEICETLGFFSTPEKAIVYAQKYAASPDNEHPEAEYMILSCHVDHDPIELGARVYLALNKYGEIP